MQYEAVSQSSPNGNIRTILSMRIATLFLAILVSFVLSSSISGFANQAWGAESTRSMAAGTPIALNSQANAKLTVSPKSITLKHGSSKTLTVKGNQGEKVTWKSSNTKVATVKSKGKAKCRVTAGRAGSAKIIGKAGKKTVVCKVTVVGKLSATSLKINGFTSKKLKLKGATAVKWRSTNTDCVIVKNNGWVLSGYFAGTARVICTDSLGNRYACKVTNKLPNITCEIDDNGFETDALDGVTRWFTRFCFCNWTNRVITLNNEAMSYFPDGVKKTSMVLIGNRDRLNSLDKAPVSVDSYDSTYVWGFSGTKKPDVSAYTTYTLPMKINSADYVGLFCLTGELVAFGPA